MLFTLMPVPFAAGYGESLLTLADAKAHLRIDVDDASDDGLIAALRDAAIDAVQQYTGMRMLETADMSVTFAGFGDGMRVGVGPAATIVVTAMSYIDSDGATQTLTDAWMLAADGAILPVTGTSWPTGAGTVTATFTAGYPVGECPPSLIAAARLMLGHLYANREAVVAGGAQELPMGMKALCEPFRLWVI